MLGLTILDERKVFAKIARLFIQYGVGIRFPARIGVVGIIQQAVETTAQIRATVRTDVSSPDAVFDGDLSLAVMTSLHNVITR